MYILAREWCFLDERAFWNAPIEFMVGPVTPDDMVAILTEAFGHGDTMRIRITGTLINEATGLQICDKMELRACDVMVGTEADLYVAMECWPLYPWLNEVTEKRSDFPYRHFGGRDLDEDNR